MDVSDIILQVVTTAGVEKMKQSVVVVMVWYTLCCAGLAFCWIFPRGSVGFCPRVLMCGDVYVCIYVCECYQSVMNLVVCTADLRSPEPEWCAQQA